MAFPAVKYYYNAEVVYLLVAVWLRTTLASLLPAQQVLQL